MTRSLLCVAALLCSFVTVYGQLCEKPLFCEERVIKTAMKKVDELTAILEATKPPSPAGINIAKGKKAYQVSIGWKGKPGFAVDGIMKPSYFDWSCTHTKKQKNPSWWVDLEKEHFVQSVEIQNRMDCCSNRLRNVQISVGNDYKVNMPVCATLTRAFGPGEVKQFNCPRAMKGRYVKVQILTTDYLTLCEVKVFGSPVA